MEPETVEIKVSPDHRKYIETLPLHHSQTLVDDKVDYVIFQYLLHPTHDFIQELFTHGENIEVIKPKSLRGNGRESEADDGIVQINLLLQCRSELCLYLDTLMVSLYRNRDKLINLNKNSV